MRDQLPLFDLTVPPPPSPDADRLRRAHDEARAITARLPAGVHFGTSSWSFPGWRGIVYSDTFTPTRLAREGLREYARHPLLTTVGVDRSYYAPLTLDDLRGYASQLPEGFRCCFKAPAAVTALALGAPGRQAPNPDFLSVDRLVSDLLLPCASVFREHTGPIILEFPPFPSRQRLEPARFLARLDRFLSALPSDFRYAVELRDRRLLNADYRALLDAHGVAHTFNYWSAMPPLAAQADVVPPEPRPFTVLRLLLRPGTWYEDQRNRFSPFNALVEPDAPMRRDVVQVARRALACGQDVFILVNNKAEGSSPLTIVELARQLADTPPDVSP